MQLPYVYVVNMQLVTLFLEWSLLQKQFCAFFAFLFCFMPVCVIVNSSFSFTLTVYLYTTHILFWSDPWRVAFSTSRREPLTRPSLPSFPLSDATALPFPLQQSHKRAGHVTSASNSLCAKQTGHSLLQNQAHI